MPPFANNYQMHGAHGLPAGPGAQAPGAAALPVSQPGMYMPQNAQGAYPQFNAVNQQGGIAPQAMTNNGMGNDFTQPNMETPAQYQSTSSQQVSPVQMAETMDGQSTLGSAGNASFDPSLYDPGDPSMFLDPSVISDLNFGNHYGALEFGMLDQMSSGILGSGDMDGMNSMGQSGSISYDSNFNPGFGLNQNFQPWNSIPNNGSRHNSMNKNFWGLQSNGMDAFAVGEHTGSLTGASPHSQNQDYGTGYQSSTTASPEQQLVQPDQVQHNDLLRQSISQAQQKQSSRKGVFPSDPAEAGLKKRRRDTSEIYDSVDAPYPYTQGFHSATAFLQKRYPTTKVLRIAKALSNVRPSFISCQKNLTREDLIFTEKSFQRSLVEHENYLNHYGSPTLICRRTLEVVAVSKEFSLLTNWRRDVLLGKEANLNVNIDGSGSGTQTGTSSRGALTPRVPTTDMDTGRPHGVLLAELLDEDSIVKFYEDYAEIAFGSERDKIVGEECSLMKYKTKDDPGWGSDERTVDNVKHGKVKQESLMRGEAGMNALGEKDGRIRCGLCWQVKRDMFDIPMFIILNVSHPFASGSCFCSRVLTPYSSYRSYRRRSSACRLLEARHDFTRVAFHSLRGSGERGKRRQRHCAPGNGSSISFEVFCFQWPVHSESLVLVGIIRVAIIRGGDDGWKWMEGLLMFTMKNEDAHWEDSLCRRELTSKAAVSATQTFSRYVFAPF